MTGPKVYCIILNFNAKELLTATIESVRRLDYSDFKIIVVDNGSNDGSQVLVKSRFPEITLIENPENLGFGEGNNVGIRYALNEGAQWIFLLNNDIRVAPNLLSALMNVAISDKRIGIIGPKIYYESEPNKIWYAGGKINYFTGIISHRGLREIDDGRYDHVEDTDYVTGCAMLVKREVFERVGLFDPAFSPMYTEDADLCTRARQHGYRVVYVPQGKVWHKVSASTGGNFAPAKIKYKIEHNLIFFKRYANWYHWFTIPICVAGASLIFIFNQLLKGNFVVVTSLFNGFAKALGRLRA